MWLEAFVAVADGTTQKVAAKDLELDQPKVSRYVGALELWLGKVLVDPSVPGQLWIDGENFLMTAIEVLTLLRDARGGRWEDFGKLRIEWLEAFNALAEAGKQTAAAAQLGVEQRVISRHVRCLSAWVGEDLLTEKGRRGLSPAGRRFLPIAQRVTRALNEARLDVSPAA